MLTTPSELPYLRNSDSRGVLTACEITQQTGYAFERYFIVSNVTGGIRGGHAHKYTNQVISCPNGNFTLSIEFNSVHQSFKLNNQSSPIFTPALTWIDMVDISSDCIILVISSDAYDINNSLRNRQDYLSYIASRTT